MDQVSRPKYDDKALSELELRATAYTAQAIERANPEEIAAGKGWYPVARQWAQIVGEAAGFRGNRARDRGAMAIGVLSPRVRWAQNLDDAMAIATDAFDHEPSAFGTNIQKASVILSDFATDSEAEEMVGGKKVQAFVDNIRFPLHSQAVVIDTWMCKLFEIPGRDIELKGVYEALAKGVQVAAHAYHMRPCEAQAIAWVNTRGPEKENVIG